ncbi:hypothetical protein MHYP_G00235510 [Metynnis hypsauchen]
MQTCRSHLILSFGKIKNMILSYCFEFCFSISLHELLLRFQHRCLHDPYTLARFFKKKKKKVIFVFLYLNICYFKYMLVYRLTIHQLQCLYRGKVFQNGTRELV